MEDKEEHIIPAMTLREGIWLAAILILAAGMKLWMILGRFVPFNSDEAVVALMARHILQGARPIFFYGQAYMGSLDAFLVAAGFAIFGQQVWVIRLVQGLLYLGFLVVVFLIGRESFGSTRVGLMTASLLAIPTVNITLYTTASLGGYGEAMLIGSLVVWQALRIGRSLQDERSPGPLWRWLLTGFLSGLGLWAFGFSLVFSLPAAFYLVWLLLKITIDRFGDDPPGSERVKGLRKTGVVLLNVFRFAGKSLLAALGGMILGALPLILFALQNSSGLLVRELGGSAIAGVEKMPWIFQVGQHLLNLVVLGGTVIAGVRPPWGVEWLALPMLPFALIFWLVVLIYSFRSLAERGPFHSAKALLFGVGLTLTVGFLFTPFGADPSGRYFLPLALPMAVFAGGLILHAEEKFGRLAPGIIALVLVYNLWGTLQCAYRYPPGITTQFYAPSQVDQRYMPQLMAFLRQQGETRGYTNYWVSYPLAFLSQEELVYVPRLPYHLDFRYTPREDRYAPYDEMVETAPRVAYITTNHPELDQRLRASFQAASVTWQEVQIGDYHVFYALSRLIRSEELDLEEFK
jgi:hypothetical protein